VNENSGPVETVKCEKLTKVSNPGPVGDRGLKRNATFANIQTPSLQEGKKMKMQ
jgi:hypothetical protein